MGATIVASTRAGDTFTGPQLVAWLQAAGFARIRLTSRSAASRPARRVLPTSPMMGVPMTEPTTNTTSRPEPRHPEPDRPPRRRLPRRDDERRPATSSATVRWSCDGDRSSTSARPPTCAALARPTPHRRRRPLRRHAGHGQHPHPHHRRAADPRLRPRRHAVRGERVRVAAPPLLGLHAGRGAAVGQLAAVEMLRSRARRRSWRRARSASSTRSSTAWSRSASAAASGAGCGTSRPSRPSTARPPTRRSATSSASSTDSLRGRRPRSRAWSISSATRRAPTRCGGRRRALPSSTASA